jgi:TonB family protein
MHTMPPHKLWLTTLVVNAICSWSAIAATSLENAIVEADRLEKTTQGGSYQNAVGFAVGSAVGKAMAGCQASSKQEKPYDFVFIISAAGRVEDVLYPPENAIAACVARKIEGLTVPRPPHGSWPVHVQATQRALAEVAPRVTKLPEASRRHLAGTGVFMVEVDKASGKVTAVKVQQSTGERLLDASAIEAFQKWRFRPQIVTRVKIPVTFTANSDAAQY